MRTHLAPDTVVTAVALVLALSASASAGRQQPNEPGKAYHLMQPHELQDPARVNELKEHRVIVCNVSTDLDEFREKLPDSLAFAGLTFMLVPDFGHGHPFWDGWRARLKESDYYHDAEGNRIKSVWNAYWVRTNPEYARRIARYFAENCAEWDGLYIDMYRLEWAPWHIRYLEEHGAVEPIDQDLHRAAQRRFGLTLRRQIGDQLMIVNTSGFPGGYVNGITLEHPTERFGRRYSIEQYRRTRIVCTRRGQPCVNVSWYEDLGRPGLVMPGMVPAELQAEGSGDRDGVSTPSAGGYGLGPDDGTVDLCPEDRNGDASVETEDLLALLSAWGERDDEIAGDTMADTLELHALLSAWGACP